MNNYHHQHPNIQSGYPSCHRTNKSQSTEDNYVLINVEDSCAQGLGRAYRDTKASRYLLLAHGSNYSQIPILPPPVRDTVYV